MKELMTKLDGKGGGKKEAASGSVRKEKMDDVLAVLEALLSR